MLKTWMMTMKNAPPAYSNLTHASLWILLILGVFVWNPVRANEMSEAARVFLEEQKLGPAEDVEILVSDPDPRLHLAPCKKYEPFVPNGARLVGRTMLGVRCVDGANWSAYLAVQIKLYELALVATRAIAAGQSLAAGDIILARVDLGTSHGGLLTDPARLVGRALLRTVTAGQALHSDMLKVQPVVSAGDTVKLVIVGAGFSIGGEGKATAQAAEGQVVPIRVESGKIITGIARQGGIAEVHF